MCEGKKDIERHIACSEHQRLAKTIQECQPITSFQESDLDPLQTKVTQAEILFIGFILEHNLPFEATAHAGPLFRKMFPAVKLLNKTAVLPLKQQPLSIMRWPLK